MSIQEITVIGGVDKFNVKEPISEVKIRAGEILGIVGATGSGKTTLISDIEQLTQKDSPSQRKILIDGEVPEQSIRTNPRKKRIAQLSQNMHFLADMYVEDFLKMHAKSRGCDASIVTSVIEAANDLIGEPIKAGDRLTVLSGGQSRALMAADIAIISDSPIVLIDEIENAGIKKHEALKLLASEGKIVIVVTHDPVLALMCERRLVMAYGGIRNIIHTSVSEKKACSKLLDVDNYLMLLRSQIRKGESIEGVTL